MSEWPEVEVRNAAELHEWLKDAPRDKGSFWLVHGKKSAGDTYLPYGVMVEELIAQGWIDSRSGFVDDTRMKHQIAPRKRGSAWSKPNRERVAKLEREGRMLASGRKLVEMAKKDGSWDILKRSESGSAPPELLQALVEGDASGDWRNLSMAVRKRSLEWLFSAKRDDTRARRIGAIVRAAREGRDPTEWTRKG